MSEEEEAVPCGPEAGEGTVRRVEEEEWREEEEEVVIWRSLAKKGGVRWWMALNVYRNEFWIYHRLI